ncbi:MAG: hypothetical protein IPM29_20235 [Planctomycetes bacterium]|nr:hypothetical protein [Planctomycetota bacterium]
MTANTRTPPPRRSARPALWLAAALLAAPVVHAQVDPQEIVRRTAEEIGKQMTEIDRLLDQSAQGQTGGRTSTAQARELVDRTQESQQQVVEGIDKLLDQLQELAQQSQSSSGSPQDQQQDQQQGGERQQQRQRQESQTPDFQEQSGPEQRQPGEQQRQPQDGQQQDREQQGGQRPQDGQERRDPGANVRDGQPVQEGTESVDRSDDGGDWGRLPPYAKFLHSRGGVPEVPARYRRLHEAWQKAVNERDRQR